jgi:hypothetical protein
MQKKSIIIGLCVMTTVLSVTSCRPVKAYQKSRINDAEMQLSARKAEKGEMNFQAYREGASGANGGKVGGGCGCN